MNNKLKAICVAVVLLGAIGLSASSCSSDSTTVVSPEPDPTPKPDPNPDPTPDPEPDRDPYDTPEEVLYKSFEKRTMCGYQGWFTCPGDSHNSRGWIHLNSGSAGKFAPGYACVDYWPDMSEYKKTYATPFVYPDGTQARIFSSSDYETVNLHFKWMKQYGIDGAIVQRFKSAVEATQRGDDHSVKVFENCLKAAKENGVAVMLEYDLSGLGANSDVQPIIDDWQMLCDKFHINDPKQCPQYLWEKGKPLVGFYALGMKKSDCSRPEQYLQMMNNFVGRDGKKGAISVLAGTG